MSDAKATAIAETALSEPARAAEANKHYRALMEALNRSKDANGEQDALMVCEALGRVIAQITDNFSDGHAAGMKRFISHRADDWRGHFAATGTAPEFFFEPEGHA